MQNIKSISEKGVIYSIVPWVLPREDIPINIKIPRNLTFDEIQIKIPMDFKYVHFFNISNVEITRNVAKISNILRSQLEETPLFFSVIVASNNIPKKLKTSKKITLKFMLNGKIIDNIQLNAKIFRPKLEVTDIIKKIELIEDKTDYKVPMKLKYIGFGDIKLKIQGEIKGKIVSQGDSIVNELIRRIWIEDTNGDLNTKNNELERRVHIEKDVIKELADKLEKKIESGDISGILDMIDEAEVDSFKDWLSSPETKSKFLNVVYTRVEDIFIDLLTDIFEKHPTDSVKLADSQTNIRTQIDSQIEIITTRLIYKDSLGNEYPPVEIPITIVDEREEKTRTTINMPIIIEKWEEDPFMNVAEMKVEEDD